MPPGRIPNSKPSSTKKRPRKSATKPENADGSSAADLVDEQLARYRDMRDFSVTAEPSGNHVSSIGEPKHRPKVDETVELPFVIQKHAASHLHYDFRLGWNGVLKSWAVAKGPSYYPGDRRLAIEVEDHPIEYGGFEGIIPKGQYGGGTVMIWDQGTWAPQSGHEDVNEGLRKGSLKFTMSGTKMHGKWTLVRMNARGGDSGRWRNSTKPNWLLIKEHDQFERGPDDPCITETDPNSAVTGRTMDQIARHEDHVWNSKDTARGEAWYRQNGRPEPAAVQSQPRQRPAKARIKKTDFTRALADLPEEKQPDFVKPQLATEVETPPSGASWVHELKLDGYRIQARKAGADVSLLTRSGLDWTKRIQQVANVVASLSARDLTLDGEAVVLAENGATDFAALQASFQEGANHPITYFCFDLLHVNGRNTRELSLLQRKDLLTQVLAQTEPESVLRVNEHLSGNGEVIFHKACELHAEGIISKRGDAPYSAGRSGAWLKAKCLHEQEFVIGGYTLSSDGADRIGSLLIGYYDAGDLIYAGRTGTGFTQKTRKLLFQQLSPVHLKQAAFRRVPSEARRGAIWVEPKLVAQVRFATWTADDLVRQAAFLGLREDKAPAEVHREKPGIAPTPKTPARSRGSSMTPAPHAAPDSPAQHRKERQILNGRPPVRLTHPKKVLDPETGLTKLQLAEYYWAVAELMLPHIAGRPLSLVRCPEGAGKPCFFQKHVNHMLPAGVTAVDVPDKKTGAPEPYITLSNAEALAGLAQMGVLEVHPWGSRNDDLEHPDRLIFDLDPDEALQWPVVCEAAADVRARLKKARLESFLKTTGGKGLHIVVPIVPELGWVEVKALAQHFVQKMERSNPSRYLTKMTKAARRGKIYLDYLRNDRGATAVAPYSPRARLGTHVSVPLPWSALKLAERPSFSVADFRDWQRRLRPDPWKKLETTKQHLNVKGIEAL